VRFCLKAYVLTNVPLIEDMLREWESLYNCVDKSKLMVSYNRLGVFHLLICDIVN
jgi:hypothetical protein